MKPKLCYVISEFNPETASHYYHIYELLEELSKKVNLFLFLEKSSSRGPKFCPYYVQKFSLPPFNIGERFVIFTKLRLEGYKRFYVHYSIFSSLISSLTGKIFGGKTFFWFSQFYSHHHHHLWEEIAFRLNLKQLTSLVTSNEGMKEYFHTTYGTPLNKIKILPLWINLKRFQKPIPSNTSQLRKRLGLQDKKVILFVHWLSSRKGADKIIPIAKRVIQRVPKSVFLIIGEGPLFSELENEVASGNLQEMVRLFGPIGNQDITQYYSLADVFLMPSKEEEFGRVILEALASGIPIVASRTIGPLSVLSDYQQKFLVGYQNTAAFSAKIIQILDSQKVAARLTREGLKIVEKYGLKNVVKRFLRVTKD